MSVGSELMYTGDRQMSRTMLIDCILFPVHALHSLALHLLDALDEWRHCQIAYWRYLEVKHGRVETMSLEELREFLRLEDKLQALRE